MSKNIAILGASADSSRFSNMAQKALLENGYTPIPVNPNYRQIDGVSCYSMITSCDADIDTVTVYVNPKILESLVDDIVRLGPRRVILNPGTESPAARSQLEAAGIEVVIACTLVLLENNRF